MLLKKLFSGVIAVGMLFSSIPVFANGVLDEDKEIICSTVEALTEEKPTGYCQFIYSSKIGVPLLKEGLVYAIDLKKYSLAEKLMDVFIKLNIDINEIEHLDGLVIKTGQKSLYEKLIESGYRLSTSYGENNLLYAAVESENLEFVDEFLNKDFDPNFVEGLWWEWQYDGISPLNLCLMKIQSIANDNNGHGFKYGENRERVANLTEIIKKLRSHGANTNTCVHNVKMDYELTTFDLLESLNPDNKENCYEKFEYFNEDTVDYCKEVYMDLYDALYL